MTHKDAWNPIDRVSGSRDKKGLLLLTGVSNFRDKVTSVKVVETSLTSNSPSWDITHQHHQIASRYIFVNYYQEFVMSNRRFFKKQKSS